MSNSTAPSAGGNPRLHSLDAVAFSIELVLAVILVTVGAGCRGLEKEHADATQRIDTDADDPAPPSRPWYSWRALADTVRGGVVLPQLGQFYIVGRSAWSPWVLLLFRTAAVFPFFIPVLSVYVKENYVDKGRDFASFIHFSSNINYLTFGVYYGFAFLATAIYLISQHGRARRLSTRTLEILNEVAALLFHTKIVSSIIITVIYSIVWPINGWSYRPLRAIDYLTHGANTVFFLVEFCLIEGSMRLSQSFIVALAPLGFYAYILFFTKVVGLFASYPYSSLLEPSKSLGAYTLLTRTGITFAWLVTSFGVYALWRLRNWAVGWVRRRVIEKF